MRVLVAGATGVIGRPLVEQLRDAGHEVVGTTRSAARAETVRGLGGVPLIVDALDTDALRRAVLETEPEVVVNQLTNLPDRLNYRKAEATFGPTVELRSKAGPALAGAAAEAGVRRLIAQSVCFFYATTGKPLHTEDDPLLNLPPRRVPVWLASLVAGKQAAVMATRLEGASNEKAKRELGWRLRYLSWRRGFREGLGPGR